MAILLVIIAFVLILVGVVVQVGAYSSEVKFAVTWTTALSALCFLIFAGRIYVP